MKITTYQNYLSLLKISDLLIGNSSSGVIEMPTFRKPTINIGKRQEGRIVPDIQADLITRVTSGEGDNVYRIVIMEPYIGSLNIGDKVELQSREDETKFHNNS